MTMYSLTDLGAACIVGGIPYKAAPVTLNNNIKLLLPFDENFNDISGNHTPVASGSAVINSNIKKLGIGSLGLDGGGYVSVPNPTFLSNGTNRFTFESWVRTSQPSYTQTIFAQYADADNTMQFGSSSNQLFFNVRIDGNLTISFHCTNTLVADTFTHIVLQRNDTSVWTIFVNGVSKSLTLDSGSYDSALINNSAPLFIGSFDGSINNFYGNIEDLCFTMGSAIYPSNFTPSTRPKSTQGTLLGIPNMTTGPTDILNITEQVFVSSRTGLSYIWTPEQMALASLPAHVVSEGPFWGPWVTWGASPLFTAPANGIVRMWETYRRQKAVLVNGSTIYTTPGYYAGGFSESIDVVLNAGDQVAIQNVSPNTDPRSSSISSNAYARFLPFSYPY